MKIEYTEEERLKALETKKCAKCNDQLEDGHVDLGDILCEKCARPVIEYAKKEGLCTHCACIGVKTIGLKEWKLPTCKEHMDFIKELMKKADYYKNKLNKSKEE
jgi:hypothetical protein